ncbi:glutamine synthetase [bacterium SM23_31]|nr:MAG: glutamine synthetase [bacterium SM23_31]
MSYTAEDVMRIVKDKNVRFINLWFTDILGILKSFSITTHELENTFANGKGFDGSSIEGFTRIQESDMVALPDPTTFTILPWKTDDVVVARMFCDINNPDGTPYEGDPRYCLKRNLEKSKQMGFDCFNIGPELEYFYFPNEKDPTPLDSGGYFDQLPLDLGTDLRKETIKSLEELGIEVEYSHHEVAPGQHEIDLRYKDALTMSDQVMTYKTVVKRVAYQRGYYATFMPKPIYGVNGSGMHTHQSLFANGRNMFFDANDKYYFSDTGKHYIAGILHHCRAFTSITNQWVNSYKRLVPGFEAPVYLSWAQRNRSALIRIPEYQPGKEKSTRIEFRSPDPACNPYLAFSVMLRAGLDGIEKKMPLGPPSDNNIYEMTEKEREEQGVLSLPESLWEAIQLTEKSEIVKEALGSHIFENLIRSKRIIWDEHRAQVTRYEIEKYMPIL